MSASTHADSVESCYPLTSMQSGMLFHSLCAPGAGLYIEQKVCDLREVVQAAVLERAWLRVIQRHAALRTSFKIDRLDEPVQEVRRNVSIPVLCEDYAGLSPDEQDACFEKYLQRDRTEDFNPSRPPLMRLALFQLDVTHYRLLWTYHHALLDGRSARTVLRDVFDSYDALLNGQELLRSPPRRFGEYVAWLRQKDVAQSKKFWQRSLKGVSPAALNGAQPIYDGDGKSQGRATLELHLSDATTGVLQTVAKENQLTMNTLIQGAWAQLLSQYAGEEEVVFGATRSLRDPAFEGIKEMVGLFINTVPFRVAIPPDMTLLAWLTMLRSQWMAMRPFEWASLTDILQWSETAHGTLLFSSVVVFEQSTVNVALKRELKNSERREFRTRSSTNYPLTLVAFAEPHLVLKLGYQRPRFAEASVRRMLGHLQCLLETLANALDKPLKSWSMLTAPERHQLLTTWQKTERAFSETNCVHQLIEKQVQQSPDAVALVCEDLAMTYRELNERSNQLAHYLQKFGIGADTFVGIFLHRSPDVIVAMLAIQKAGGAYLVLDAAYPQQRLKAMIEDSKLPVIITVDELAVKLPEAGAKIICLDDQGDQIALEDASNPATTIDPENLAYVVFTSGSTGRPKGILIPHRALTNHTLALIDNYDISCSDRRLQFVSLSSDVLIAETFPYLATGATIVIRPKSDLASISDFLQFLHQQKITVVGVPSALWHEWVLLMSRYALPCPSSLRLIITGMDRVRSDMFAIWKAKVGNCVRWVNAYGPSEATCTTTTYEADLSSDETLASVPIGRPIANANVYILNAQLDPVPIGVTGEIYIGGTGVARDYLNNPGLTAEKFIPNPFSHEPQGCLFKTGDLARYRDDGNIEFLGRVDNQVKLRGYRIELGEIESALSGHPAVHDCAAMLREDRPGDARLAAYVVPANGQISAAGELRRFLGEKLPAYMLPSTFVVLDRLPLSSNGKVDRRALPGPDTWSAVEEGDSVPPRTLLEEALAAIWTDLLGLEHVGVHDNFFALGGHSLLAIQLMNRIEREFNKDLPFAALFENATIEKLARLIEGTTTKILTEVVEIQPLGSRPPLFLVHGIGGDLLYAHLMAKHLGVDQPVYGLQSVGDAERRFEEMASRLVSAIRRTQPQGSYHLCGHCFGGMLAFEIAQQLRELGCEVALLVVMDERLSPARRSILNWAYIVLRFLGNLPFRLADVLYFDPPDRLLWRIKARLHRLLHDILARLRKDRRRLNLADIVDVDRLRPGDEARWQRELKAVQNYRPLPYDGRLILVRARTRPLFSGFDHDLGWGPLLKTPPDVRVVPGHHANMLDDPQIGRIANILAAELAAANLGNGKSSPSC